MNISFDKQKYWEKKILPWEVARYEGSALLRPQSWTLRRRLNTGFALAADLLPRHGSVLELGCGSGILANRLAPLCSTYLGIDFAQAAVESARERVKTPGASFLQADVRRAELPLSDLTIFLGLVDWLEPDEIAALFRRLRSRRLLFSFTERARSEGALNPYARYRAHYDSRSSQGAYSARSFRPVEIASWLANLGRFDARFVRGSRLDPGTLVVAERGPASEKKACSFSKMANEKPDCRC